MLVRLKGLNRVVVTLADGTRREYCYAGKGKGNAIRLRGGTGSRDDREALIASAQEAAARRLTPPGGMLLSVLVAFERSAEFAQKAERTQSDYRKIIDKRIEPEFGDMPLAALTDKRTRGAFKAWRDRLALSSPRQADYAWVILARVLSWALDRGMIDTNPCERGGRLYHGSRRDKVWSDDQEAAMYALAPPQLHLPLMLALWTGQRQGDLLRLPWSAYDGTHIRLRQSKTRTFVTVPVGAPLKAMLDATPRLSPIILLSTDNRPWTSDGFSSSWRKACKRAGVSGVTFHDLRGTAVTRLALVGCTEAEIATITGLSLASVRAILDAHYFHRDPALAESAIRKLETRTDFSKNVPNGPTRSDAEGAKR
jgi:integrase